MWLRLVRILRVMKWRRLRRIRSCSRRRRFLVCIPLSCRIVPSLSSRLRKSPNLRNSRTKSLFKFKGMQMFWHNNKMINKNSMKPLQKKLWISLIPSFGSITYITILMISKHLWMISEFSWSSVIQCLILIIKIYIQINSMISLWLNDRLMMSNMKTKWWLKWRW